MGRVILDPRKVVAALNRKDLTERELAQRTGASLESAHRESVPQSVSVRAHRVAVEARARAQTIDDLGDARRGEWLVVVPAGPCAEEELRPLGFLRAMVLDVPKDDAAEGALRVSSGTIRCLWPFP